MTETKTIEIIGHKQKELLLYARLSWCEFTVLVRKDETIPENLKLTLRFLDLERKLDNINTLNEIILEAPEEEASLFALAKISKSTKVKVTFELDDDTYFFFSSLNDIFTLLDRIPVISLKWPESLFKKHSRLAERIKSASPAQMESDKFYVRDISSNGIGVFCETPPALEEGDQIKNLHISIPLLKKVDEKLVIQYTTATLDATITRFLLFKNKFTLIGCKFNKPDPKFFFLLRQYFMLRKREEEFFEKNQYYPKLSLPEVTVNQEPFKRNAD